MENIWIFILLGVAFGSGTSIGNRIIAILGSGESIEEITNEEEE